MSSMTFIVKITVILFSLISVSSKTLTYQIGKDSQKYEILRLQRVIDDTNLLQEYKFRTDLFWDADYFGFSHYIAVMGLDKPGTDAYSTTAYIFGDDKSELTQIWSNDYEDLNGTQPPREVTESIIYPIVYGIKKHDDESEKMYRKGGNVQKPNGEDLLLREYDSPTVFFWEAENFGVSHYIAVTKPDQPEGSESTLYILDEESSFLKQFGIRWNSRKHLFDDEALSKPQKVKQSKYYPMRYSNYKNGREKKTWTNIGGTGGMDETLANEYESREDLIWSAKAFEFSHYIATETYTLYSHEFDQWTLPFNQYIFCKESDLRQIRSIWEQRHQNKDQEKSFELIKVEESPYYPIFSIYRFGYLGLRDSVRVRNTNGRRIGSSSSRIREEDIESLSNSSVLRLADILRIQSDLITAAADKGCRHWAVIYGGTTGNPIVTGWIFGQVAAQIKEIKMGEDEQITEVYGTRKG